MLLSLCIKKIFPTVPIVKESSLMHPDMVDIYDTNLQDKVSNENEKKSPELSNNLVVYVNTGDILNILHKHNIFVRNMTNVLFKLPVFYNEKSETIDYYSLVINKMLHINSLIENISSSLLEQTYSKLINEQRNIYDIIPNTNTEIEYLEKYIESLENIL